MSKDKERKIGEISDGNDSFDFDKLRLSQNFSELSGVKKATLTIPVRRPNRHEFIWVRPGEEWRFATAVLELKEERETYLVDTTLWPILANEIVPKVLFTVINRQNVLSIWPVRLPGEDGGLDRWNRSALEAAELAQKHWIRLASNMSLGAYEVHIAESDFPEPEWPEISFKKILQIAFKDNFIQTPDHSVVQRLRGLL
jgi:hypothetical protein